MSLGIDAQTMTKIQELPGLLQENLLAAQEARTQVEELFVSRMEELYEDFDASFAKFDILTSALDSYTSIIDIVGS
jgi:hypothetical protein